MCGEVACALSRHYYNPPPALFINMSAHTCACVRGGEGFREGYICSHISLYFVIFYTYVQIFKTESVT